MDISNFFIKNVYAASDFFDDYPKMKFNLITSNVADKASEVFGNWYTILKWAWVFMFAFSVISFAVSAARLAIHSTDNPFIREDYRHDMYLTLVLIAILGAMPTIFVIIINILGNRF